ncbi:MAG: two pore domain potassium channel family protein [Hyphomicrobiaceae bacterium]|nr:two pore domain potassium channel family protein [Hyphomicrobiaceae bacterium]MCC0011325.1 two pore domain potassium channel family protein [Hyphomicrobiaceae bacterium]
MTLKKTLYNLYHGHDPGARTFRFAILTFDLASILFFIGSSLLHDQPWIYTVDAVIAVFILLDLAARFWIDPNRRRMLWQLTTWADVIVIITLLLPSFLDSFLFLRVLRALRLLRSYRVLADLRTEFEFFRRNEDVIQSVVNLLVFVFIMTALVYVFQVHTNTKISNYIDALYFTVTALTTTGFGDITLEGTSGKLLSIIILLIGVALFLRLVQTIFRPPHVSYECPDCGLKRHDTDAVHCKHCGRVLHIATEGEGD